MLIDAANINISQRHMMLQHEPPMMTTDNVQNTDPDISRKSCERSLLKNHEVLPMFVENNTTNPKTSTNMINHRNSDIEPVDGNDPKRRHRKSVVVTEGKLVRVDSSKLVRVGSFFSGKADKNGDE